VLVLVLLLLLLLALSTGYPRNGRVRRLDPTSRGGADGCCVLLARHQPLPRVWARGVVVAAAAAGEAGTAGMAADPADLAYDGGQGQ